MAKKKAISPITEETRAEANATAPKEIRKEMILKILNEPKSARTLAYELGFTERNAVAPRLTELCAEGLVYVAGKETDKVTGKKVAVYRKVEK